MIDALFQIVLPLVWLVLKIVIIVVGLLVGVVVMVIAERRLVGFIQGRLGPNRIGPFGVLQPVADAVKLLFKEIIVPRHSNRFLYLFAPMLMMTTTLSAWAVIPFDKGWMIANLDCGLLYLFAMTSVSVYGVIIAGWASNSRYAFLGALRSAAQIVSYEIPMGFALVGVLMAAGSMNLSAIVTAQMGGVWHWFALPLLPLFVVYWVSAVAETNRAPFDVAEGESEIVAGFHVEYAGMSFALFFMAEYINMILVAVLASLMFLGGWLSPFENIPGVGEALAFVPGIVWLGMKASFMVFLFLWFRATFPRYRYDQIMRLGWKVFLPITLVWIVFIGVGRYIKLAPWFT